MDSHKSLIYRTKSRLYHYLSQAGTLWMLFYDPFSAYQVIQTWCKQMGPLKRFLNLFCRNEYFKHVIDGKVDETFRLGSREK